MIYDFYDTFIAGNQKAIVGFAVPFLLTALATIHITGSMTVQEALQSVGMGLLTSASVWFKANK